MKNEKGFTLIELLAVIVILAVIALIATPIILNVIEESRKKAFVATATNIISAAEIYMANTYFTPTPRSYVNVELPGSDILDYRGEQPDYGQVIVVEDGRSAIVAVKNNYCAVKKFTDDIVSLYYKDDVECSLEYEADIYITPNPLLPNGDNGFYITNVDHDVVIGNDVLGYEYQISTDGSTFTPWSELTTASNLPLTVESENVILRVRTKDKLELYSSPIELYYKIDKTAPTCGTISGASTTWTSSNRTVSVGCSDNFGCTLESFSKTFDTTTQSGNIEIKDNAGNKTSCPVNAYVDKKTYTVTITNNTGGKVTASSTKAVMGTKITLTVSPNTNYALNTLTFSGVSGSTSTRSFTMPRSNVTITSTWKVTLITQYRKRNKSAKVTIAYCPDGQYVGAANSNLPVSQCSGVGYVIGGVCYDCRNIGYVHPTYGNSCFVTVTSAGVCSVQDSTNVTGCPSGYSESNGVCYDAWGAWTTTPCSGGTDVCETRQVAP